MKKLTKEIDKNEAEKHFFTVRISPDLVKQVNRIRVKNHIKWGALVTAMFNRFIREERE